jgi:hypothetical protein
MVEALYKDATSSAPAGETQSAALTATARALYDTLMTDFPGVDIPGTQERCELLPFDMLRDLTDEPLLRLQETISSDIADQVYIENLRVQTTEWGVRLLTGAKEGAAVFQAVPKWESHSIPSDDFLDIVNNTLGLALSFLGEELPCRCGRGIIDRQGRHIQVTCPLGNAKQVRHNSVVAVWVAMLRFAGFHVTLESSNSLRIVNPQTNERTDFTIHNWPNVTAHEFDVCITDARSVAHSQTPKPLVAATTNEDRKIKHYKDKLKGANAEFTPLVIEAGGRFGKQAAQFFKKAVHAVSLQTNMSKSCISTYWKQRLVVTLRRVGIRQQRMQALKLYGMNPELIAEQVDELGMEDVEYVRGRGAEIGEDIG